MSHVRTLIGPNGELLADNRSPAHVERDRERLTALLRSVSAILHPLQTEEERQQRITNLRSIHGLFAAVTDGDGKKHQVDGTANLSSEEKRFLIYAASRSTPLFTALTLGRWSEVVSLLAAAKAFGEKEELRSGVVLKLAQLSNGTEDVLLTQVIGVSGDKTLAA